MKPQPKQIVWVHYTGKFSDGTVFNTTDNNAPLSFPVGVGQVIKGFDAAIMDMEPGEKRTVVIPVADAYGDRNEDLVIEFPLSEFPEGEKPKVGMELMMADNAGNTFPCIVVEVREESAMLDANHPLCGHELTFDIWLLSIEKELPEPRADAIIEAANFLQEQIKKDNQ